MSSRQPITHFGHQAAKSVKEQRTSATSNLRQRGTPTNRPSQGKLTFKRPDAPRIPSSPIVIDDDPTPVEETAASWERGDESFFYEPNRGPYDETWRPMEQDQVEESEDESVAPVPKSRQQPQRMASTRKVSGRGVDALQPDALGMWTPPASNARTRRTGERVDQRTGSSLKGKEKAPTPVTSDPVDTPVYRGPSTKATSSATQLAPPRTEPFVEVSPMTARSSAPRNLLPTNSARDTSGNSSRNVDQQGRHWLKKRTNDHQGTQKRTVQTKMTTFISDRPPTQSSSAYQAPVHNPVDTDVFEESVQFVKARNTGHQAVDKTVMNSRPDVSSRTKSAVSTRPQPQRKKRKSDEIGNSSDTAEKAIASDATAHNSDVLASRLTAHKRFKVQNDMQQDVQDPLSDTRMETSSLTSLSKNPSSELDINQEPIRSGLKVVRGRGCNRPMNVIYSSDADEAAAEVRKTHAELHEDQAPVDPAVPSTLSSVVPGSQPGYDRDSEPWYYHLQAARIQPSPMVAPAQAPEFRSSGIPLRSDAPPAEEQLFIAGSDHSCIPRPSVLSNPLRTTSTDKQDGVNSLAKRTSLRPLARADSRTHIEKDIAGGRNTESLISEGDIEAANLELSERTEKDLDHSSLSQQREEAARKEKYRQLIPSLVEDDFEAALPEDPQSAAISAGLARRTDGGQSNNDSASQYSETYDYHRIMRKIFPPPIEHKELTAQLLARKLEVPQQEDAELVEQQAVEMEQPETPDPSLPLSRSSWDPGSSIRRPSGENISKSPVNSKPPLRPASPVAGQSYNIETMLPLTLDTQLHRPGILSPNFQLRRKPSRQNPAVLQTIAKDPITPKKRQRFATQLITPGKQASPYMAGPEATRTPQQRRIPNPAYKSPESMIENVETLATWSPAKYQTQRSLSAGQEQWGIDDEEKENQPPQIGPIDSAGSRAPQSLDEIIDGTYGHIQSFHLLETYHRGYTPRKESAVIARENALPRVIKRLHGLTEPKPAFAEVDQAWAGLESETSAPKTASLRKASSKKVDTAEQSKLSQHGFLKNENVRKCPPAVFGRPFKDEDDVMAEDDEDLEHVPDRESSSPTPRKAPAGPTLGTVPIPPLDPRLKPAGVREVQRRQRFRESEEQQQHRRHDKGNDDEHKLDSGFTDRERPIERSEDDDVPSSQAYENQDPIFRSDSTNEMELQVSAKMFEEMRQMHA
ncbi:hypothetical protein QFC21_002451 [Naganishia friedmannii]|uniref:Uncharacterized protein n=1 Tax=Naganishia friedmannii TaxID=89922 RepID=A0ACC2VX30_9TREE|nr:hypothetical protein QFC21_002451 [Naganishia friedmannii]